MRTYRFAYLVIVITIFVLSVCGCTQKNENDLKELNENNDAGMETVDTVVSTVEESEQLIEVVEEVETEQTTEFISSLPYMRTIELDNGLLLDGVYLILDITFDEDGLGCTANVWGHDYLLEEDIALLNTGDVIYYKDYWYSKDQEMICEYIVDGLSQENSYGGCGLIELFNGQYILWGEDSAPITTPEYLVVGDYHLNISENVLIFDNASVYGISSEVYENYIDEGYYQAVYPDVISFADDWENHAVRHPAIFVVVENETIISMFVNPQLHQNWHSNQ